MIGIHIYSNKLDDYQDNHLNITRTFGEYKFTVSYHNEANRQSFSENDNFAVFIDGWIFNAPSYLNQVDYLIELINNNQLSELPYLLDGQFNICIINKYDNTWTYFTDIYSLRKHYFSIDSDFMLSSDLEFIKLYKNPGLNKQHLIKHLKMLRFIDIKQTFFDSINAVSPCMTINIADKISIEEYDYEIISDKYSSSNFDEDVLVNQFINNAKYVHKDQNVLLELSGGLDSRFVLEVFKKAKVNVETMTYGIKNSDELNIAKDVAKLNEVNHNEISLTDKDFVNDIERYIKSVGGMDLFVQSNVYEVFNSLNHVHKTYIIDTGLYLDFLLGDIYTSEQNFKEKSNVLGKDSFLTEFNDKNRIQFVLKNRFYSSLAIRLSAHREYFDDRYSMLSYKNFFQLINIPIQLRKDYAFYQNISKKIVTNSFNVPLHNTMYGISLDISLWDSAKQAQLDKEKIAIENFRLTGKAIYHNRYYSDFDMWLRDKKSWKELVEKLLLMPNSLIYEFIDKEYIYEVIKDHMDALKSQHTLLIKWMSIEIFLRTLNQEENYE